MYSSIDGYTSDFHLVHVGSFAMHGVGLFLMEATSVSPNGGITPRDTGLYLDGHITNLKRIADFAHEFDAKIGIQLAHAGRKGSTYPPFVGRGHGAAISVGEPDEPENNITKNGCKGFEVDGPSAVRWSSDLAMPHELSVKEIKKIVSDFAMAAERADKAGFDTVEIHAAHGYLIHQFLSPVSNKRTDEYGGSFDNRVRFLLEICEAIRRVFPKEKPILIRFSCSDWLDDGWNLEETTKLTKILYERRLCDLVDCSAGGIVSGVKPPTLKPGYQVPYAAHIKKSIPDIQVGTVGLITEPKHAEQILQDGDADVVMLAREFLRNPAWIQRADSELGVTVDRIAQCRRAKESHGATFAVENK
jgi:2,4-dienoyl-CoA reductase-like NADH-dependent reductase (Old Yellow Enzyme family)